jgi:hypothetical protein
VSVREREGKERWAGGIQLGWGRRMGQRGERRKKKKRGRKERWAELGYAGRARLWAEEKKKMS